ncbi:DUF4345 domain-containing protein [Arthrobacter agilis]|uniref:DUF4345 domain-containing protein n=1 Tax=Arthrobacter agilis TaxID=37921 RepID=UPI002789F4E6|nr:DUF4345 domain-containing protein [Arthrobacter agilis]MDQ0734224.1 hypothetical protein [Arthrobacter agilis]
MTSNSPEHESPSASGGRGRDGAGPAGTPREPERPVAPSTPPSRRADTTAAGDATGATTAATTGSTTGATTPARSGTAPAKGRKPGKGSSSGDDWNVFRTVVVLVGLVLAAFGAYYLILGTAGLPDTEADPVNPTLESQFRFFSAMMVGVGAAFITIAIKFQWANMLWLVCLMVFIGGIGRVLSWAFSGTPNYILIILMVVELAFPPALLVWHRYIAKTSDLRREFAQRG